MPRLTFPPRTGFALVLIAVGTFLLLDRLDLFEFRDLVKTWWPLVLIYLGVQKLSNSGRRGTWWPFILIAVGLLFILNNLDIIDSDLVRTYWPVIFLIFGLYILLDAFRSKPENGVVNQELPANTIVENTILVSAVLTGNSQKYISTDFKGGVVSCIMGGAEIDLRQCELKGVASLDVTCVMGGCEIRIPDDWNVVFKGSPVLGGFGDSRKSTNITTTKTLEITGLILMGGLDIK